MDNFIKWTEILIVLAVFIVFFVCILREMIEWVMEDNR